jgi:hypothetical protein
MPGVITLNLIWSFNLPCSFTLQRQDRIIGVGLRRRPQVTCTSGMRARFSRRGGEHERLAVRW